MHVLNILPDDRLGGPQIRSRKIAADLADRGVETSFLVPDTGGEFPEYARSGGFTVHTVPFQRIRAPLKVRENLSFLRSFRSTVTEIQDIIDGHRYDVAHVNVSTNFQGARATALSEAGLVWHFNDTLTPTPVKQVAARSAIKWCDEVVVAADAVSDYYFPSRLVDPTTVYAPVDTEAFSPSRADQEWPAGFLNRSDPPEVPVIGTVGNLNPAKGLEYFIRAIDRLRTQWGPVVAPIVGRPLETRRSYFSKLQRLVSERGLEDTVFFCGFRDDIADVLNTFEVFVLSSVTEACPMVVLEAMAMERPVVATDVGGVREQIKNGRHGLIVPPSEPTAMADSIASILKSPSLGAELGANARERTCDQFGVQAIADRTLAVYESAADAGDGGQAYESTSMDRRGGTQ